MPCLILSLLLALLLLPVAGAEEPVYRWTDARGATHFGSEPPEGVQAEEVQMNSRPVKVQSSGHVYTWKDAEGKIHYGDKPPEDQAVELLDTESESMSTVRGTKFRKGERELLERLEERYR